MADEKDTKINSAEASDSSKADEDNGFTKHWDFKNEPFDGTNVFKTGEVNRILEEAIAMIEESWDGKPITRKIGDISIETKETENSEKPEQSEENVLSEGDLKWQELERLARSPELAEDARKERKWQEREWKLRQEGYQKEGDAKTDGADRADEADKTDKAKEEDQKAETTEPTEADGKTNEEEEDTKDPQKFSKSKKFQKSKRTERAQNYDTESIVKRLIKTIIVLGALFAVFVVVRIIYVNITYPSTKINMLNQNQKFTGQKYNMAVNDAVIYSKEKWVEYLKNNIPEDEDFDADRYASIPGAGEDYDIACVELSVSNTSDEIVELSGIKIGLILYSGYQPAGYSIFIREKTDNSKLIKNYEVEPGQTREFVFAYVIEEKFKKDLMLQYCELGNNQRMVPEFREVR